MCRSLRSLPRYARVPIIITIIITLPTHRCLSWRFHNSNEYFLKLPQNHYILPHTLQGTIMALNDILHSYTSTTDCITAYVFESSFGGFGVSLKDDDSGEFVGCAIHGIKTIEEAIKRAKSYVDMV